jgi:hypothetical protein
VPSVYRMLDKSGWFIQASRAGRGTTIRRPSLIDGRSPEWARLYACAREIPSISAASSTVSVMRLLVCGRFPLVAFVMSITSAVRIENATQFTQPCSDFRGP